jgi:hypothetical protein
LPSRPPRHHLAAHGLNRNRYAENSEPFAAGEKFRSVVQTDILSERPATLAIILIARLKGLNDNLKQAL